jgi:hypothetical protein
MNDPLPGRVPPSATRPPVSLEDSARALAELHRQMIELNARLEYLHLLLKLGVR